MRPNLYQYLLLTIAAVPASAQAQEQPDVDRIDPAILEEQLETRDLPRLEFRPVEIDDAPVQTRGPALRNDVIPGAIQVRGASRLPVAAFARAIEPFIGRPLGENDLAQLATAVAGVARRAGYGLATAWIPAQDLANGVLAVQVDEGRIDAVRAQGPGAAFVQTRLAGISDGQPVRTEDLERQLMLAGDVGGMSVGAARLVREGDRNVLIVATQYRPVEGRVTVDNWGSDSIGQVRATAEVRGHGIVTAGDALTAAIATTPLEPANFQLVEARYRTPAGSDGTTVALASYYGRTDVEPNDDGAGLSGESWEVELEVVHPLVRSRSRSLWLTGRMELRDSALGREGRILRDDRIASVTASAYGYDRLFGGRLRARASLVQGLGLLGATELGDPRASRDDASGVFTKLESWAEYWRRLNDNVSLELAVRAQIADGPLLSSEEFGLGGPHFLRAFDYRELSGDQGAAGSAELRYDFRRIARFVKNLQLYGYSDVGRVINLGASGRGGTLASAGGGFRLSFAQDWHTGIELGVPLTVGRNDEAADPRFSFSLGKSF